MIKCKNRRFYPLELLNSLVYSMIYLDRFSLVVFKKSSVSGPGILGGYGGSNIRVGWININFSKIDPKQKQTNVGHHVADEIINGNSEKMCYNVKKVVASVFEKKLKVIYDSIQKKLCWLLLKEYQNLVTSI